MQYHCLCHLRARFLEIIIFCYYSLRLSNYILNSPQMWMNVRSMEHVQNTPPVQTPSALLYVLVMKDSWRMAVCALVRYGFVNWWALLMSMEHSRIKKLVFWSHRPLSIAYKTQCGFVISKSTNVCYYSLPLSMNLYFLLLILHRCEWMWDQWNLSRTLHMCKHLWLFCMHLQWRIHEEWQCVHW